MLLRRLAARMPVVAGAGLVAGLAAAHASGPTHVQAAATPVEDRGRTAGVFGGGLGFGKKSAVVVVDFVNAYTTPGSLLYCPDPEFGVVPAVAETKPLLELARAKGVDVVYTKVLYAKHGKDGGVFVQKVPVLRTMVEGNPMTDIVASLQPEEEDTVLVKKYPSAFFGTELASMLTARGVDTIILVGCSTSGCIRATALDAMQHGFRCVVPRECVGDRTAAVHESNLFDINSKNGDVLPKRTVMDFLSRL